MLRRWPQGHASRCEAKRAKHKEREDVDGAEPSTCRKSRTKRLSSMDLMSTSCLAAPSPPSRPSLLSQLLGASHTPAVKEAAVAARAAPGGGGCRGRGLVGRSADVEAVLESPPWVRVTNRDILYSIIRYKYYLIRLYAYQKPKLRVWFLG